MCEAVLAAAAARSSGASCTSGPPGRWRTDAADDVVTAAAVSMHWTAAGMTGRGRRVEPAGGAARPVAATPSPRRGATTSGALEAPRPGDADRPARPRPRGRRAPRGWPATRRPPPPLLEEALRGRRRSTGPTGRARAGAAGLLPLGGRADRRAAGRRTPRPPARSGPRSPPCHAQVWGALARGGADHGRVRRGGPAWPTGRRRRPRARHAGGARRRAHHPRHRRRHPRGRRRRSTSCARASGLARDVEDRAVLCRAYANLILAYEFTGLPAEACAAALEGLALLPEYGLELAVGAALACNAANMLVRRGHYDRCAAVLADLLDGRAVQGQGLHLHLERAELQLAHGRPGGGARPASRPRRRCEEADEPAVVAALAAATGGAARPGGRPRRLPAGPSTRRCARLAGTQDRRFRTELLVIGLRNEADRGRAGARPRPTRRPRRGWTGWPPSSSELGAADGRRRQPRRRTTARRATSWPGRGAPATAADWAEAVAARGGPRSAPARRRTACCARRSATPTPSGGTRRRPRRRAARAIAERLGAAPDRRRGRRPARPRTRLSVGAGAADARPRTAPTG